jgi:hypothetical protein
MRLTSPFRRLPCTTLAGVVMIVGMPACAGDPSEDQPPDGAAGEGGAAEGSAGDAGAVDAIDETTLAAGVAATRAVGRARVELQITVAGPDGPVAMVHRAAFTDGGLRAEASSDMSQAAAALEAAGQELEGDWSHPTGVVIDGDAVYSQLGPMADALGHDPDDWVRARVADVTVAGAENDALALALDPLGPLDLLYRPVGEVAELGQDDVRGVRARHLRATLDLAGAQAAPAASFEARLVAAGVDALPVDVWLDDGGVVRRLLVSLDDAGTMTTRFDVYDVEADVAVTPPAADEVVALRPPPADGTG